MPPAHLHTLYGRPSGPGADSFFGRYQNVKIFFVFRPLDTCGRSPYTIENGVTTNGPDQHQPARQIP